MPLEPPRWWYGARIPPAAWGLLPISAAYGALVQRRFGAASPYRGKLPVICVGNFTMGGAGKTPVALKLAAMLREAGRKPGFLSRGYGGKERGPHVVDPASDIAVRVGDEPLLLAQAAPTVISRDRPAGARLLETMGIDTIVMDDGFQNPTLHKDFSLIVIDAGAGIGSGRVFPLGPLRAPLAFQAAMTDAIAIVGAGPGAGGDVLENINLGVGRDSPSPCLSPPRGEGTPLQRARPAPSPLGGEGCGEGAFFTRGLNAFEASTVPTVTDAMRAQPFLAFCGIGRPAKFFDTLSAAGIRAVKTRAFPDHHPYTEADALSLIGEAKALGAGLLTTEKDLARLKSSSGALLQLCQSALALPIAIEFAPGHEAALMRAILSKIHIEY